MSNVGVRTYFVTYINILHRRRCKSELEFVRTYNSFFGLVSKRERCVHFRQFARHTRKHAKKGLYEMHINTLFFARSKSIIDFIWVCV